MSYSFSERVPPNKAIDQTLDRDLLSLPLPSAPSGATYLAVAPFIPVWLSTPRGAPWWSDAKRNYPRSFVADVASPMTTFSVAPW